MKTYDELCSQLVAVDASLMIPWYLMASYGYYSNDRPILSDFLFDRLAAAMLASWDELHHIHKQLITPADLEAGTLLLKEYPKRVILAYQHLIQQPD